MRAFCESYASMKSQWVLVKICLSLFEIKAITYKYVGAVTSVSLQKCTPGFKIADANCVLATDNVQKNGQMG